MRYHVVSERHGREVILARTRREAGGIALFDEHVRSHMEHMRKHSHDGEFVDIRELDEPGAVMAVEVVLREANGKPVHATRMLLRRFVSETFPTKRRNEPEEERE